MKHFLIILSLMLIFAMPGCEIEPLKKKDPPEPTLPPITTEGKNTFGCLVDGKLYLPQRSGIKSALIREYYDSRNSDLHGSLKIGAHRWKADGEPPTQKIEMRLHNRVFSEGKYILYTDSTMHANNLFVNYVNYSYKNVSGSNWDFFSNVTY